MILILSDYKTDSTITKFITDQFENKEFHYDVIVDEYNFTDWAGLAVKRFDHINKLVKKLKPTAIVLLGAKISELMFKKPIAELVNADDLFTEEKIKCFVGVHEDILAQMPQHYDLNYNAIRKATEVSKSSTPHHIIDIAGVIEVAEYAKQTGYFCFDFETTSLDWFKFPETLPTVLSISVQPGYSYVLPLFHKESNNTPEEIFSIFQYLQNEIFANPEVIKVGVNLKFDKHWCAMLGVTSFRGRYVDAQLQAHSVNENRKVGLKELTKEYFPEFAGYDDKIDYHGPLTPLCAYAAIDTDLSLRLHFYMERLLLIDAELDTRLTPQEKLHHRHTLYLHNRNLTMLTEPALFDAESHGAPISEEQINAALVKATALLEAKDKKLMAFTEIARFENDQRQAEINKKLHSLNESYSKEVIRFEASIDKKINKHRLEIEEIKEELETITDSGKRTRKQNMINARYTKIEYDEVALKTGSKKMIDLQSRIAELKAGVYSDYKGVNFDSPKQLSSILFDYFKLPLWKDPYKGEEKRTTDKKHLKELKHPFPQLLMARRSLAKMISTYYNGILKRRNSTGNFFFDFNQHGTVTGRVSSFIHTMPKRTQQSDEDVKWAIEQVQKFFINKGDEYVMVQADYGQAELRVIANYADDAVMKDAYRTGKDIHSITGSRISGVPFDEFKSLPDWKNRRFLAKAANFGWVYKQSIPGYVAYVKEQYGIEINEEIAKQHRAAIFETYRSLLKWHEKYEMIVKKYGYVRTIFGRKRRLPEVFLDADRWRSMVNQAIRNAINSPIQGSAGELALFCAGLLRLRLPKECIFFNTIHDSVFYFIPKTMLQRCLKIISETCANPPVERYFTTPGFYFNKDTIHMQMDFELSTSSWGEMKELENLEKIPAAFAA